MDSVARKTTCFVVDQEPGTGHVASSVLRELNVDVECFDTIAKMLERRATVRPDLILVDVTVHTAKSREYLAQLVEAQIDCPIRPLSGLNPLLRAESGRVWARSGLKVLPPIAKPLRQQALKDALQGLVQKHTARPLVTMGDVIDRGWFELWYQPRIDVQSQTLAGAEGLFRARHPERGIVTAAELLSQATEAELLALTTRVIGRAMDDWKSIRKLGIPVDFSINVPVCALKKLSLFGIFWEQALDSSEAPRLTLELNESEIVPEMALAFAAKKELQPYGVNLAIDSFGMSCDELLRYPELPFDEVKIDRSFICNCDTDLLNAGLCELIIDFCHRYRAKAVAEGVETAGELRALRKMGCDMAQGYLLARPMQKVDFIKVLQQRSAKRA